jgi:type III pantothenate kinase
MDAPRLSAGLAKSFFSETHYMIICIDVGNTNIVIGGYEGERSVFQSRIATDLSLTGDQYAVALDGALRLNSAAARAFTGGVVSSVVPALTELLAAAAKRVTGVAPMIVGPGTHTGLELRIDNPGELGGDLKAAAVAAKSKYPLPCIIIDMGTATTFTALAADGAFLGGAIVPGLKVSVESLVSRTSMLVGIPLSAPQTAIGSNTVDCMKSGAVLGAAAMVDGMCARIAAELGQKPCIVATGGLAHIVVPRCEAEISLDENLVMDGLRTIYEINKTSRSEE